MEVDAVGDDRVEAAAGCHQAGETWLTVVEGRHGVEDMCEGCCADG